MAAWRAASGDSGVSCREGVSDPTRSPLIETFTTSPVADSPAMIVATNGPEPSRAEHTAPSRTAVPALVPLVAQRLALWHEYANSVTADTIRAVELRGPRGTGPAAGPVGAPVDGPVDGPVAGPVDGPGDPPADPPGEAVGEPFGSVDPGPSATAVASSRMATAAATPKPGARLGERGAPTGPEGERRVEDAPRKVLHDESPRRPPKLVVECGRPGEHRTARWAARRVGQVVVGGSVAHQAVEEPAGAAALPLGHASASSQARSRRARVRDEIFRAFAWLTPTSAATSSSE